jgi:ABC-2 type transport system ATP-binding protein
VLGREMRVRSHLVHFGRLQGLSPDRAEAEADRALHVVGLPDAAQRKARTLSHGMLKAVGVAQAFLGDPELVLLDEPTAGLDPDSRRAFWEHVRATRGHLTVLLATNDVLEAERECESVAFLHQGRIVAQGTPEELKRGLMQDSVRVECTNGRAAMLSQEIAAWPGVGHVTAAGQILQVTVEDVSSFVPRLFQTSPEAIHAIRIEPSTLEDAYFAVAGASLRRDEHGEQGAAA